jgi:hypothetical protein
VGPGDARVALLSRLIDHAPPFAPASLPLKKAIAEDRRARESTPSWALALDRDAFSWRDRRAGAEDLHRARHDRLYSIGSCSFFEPVQELEQLGVLPL